MKDEKYRIFSLNIIGETRYELIGVRIPELRTYAKKLLNSTEKPLFHDRYYEEVMIHGFYIGLKKCPYEEKVQMIDEFLPSIDCWGICDSFISTLKFIKKNLDKYLEHICKYLDSKQEFTQRYAFVCLLNYYLDDKYYDLLCRAITNTKYNGYYSKMASAWLLSYMFMKHYEKTCIFVNENRIDDFVIKKFAFAHVN